MSAMMNKSALALAALAACGLSAPLAAQSSGVFVEQIGNGNTGSADQSNNAQSATLNQDGNGNFADIDQQNGGPHTVRVEQTGDDNDAIVLQAGDGAAGLTISQDGTENSAIVGQTDNGGVGSLAEIVQSGNSNSVSLIQDGTDNQANLTTVRYQQLRLCAGNVRHDPAPTFVRDAVQHAAEGVSSVGI